MGSDRLEVQVKVFSSPTLVNIFLSLVKLVSAITPK